MLVKAKLPHRLSKNSKKLKNMQKIAVKSVFL